MSKQIEQTKQEQIDAAKMQAEALYDTYVAARDVYRKLIKEHKAFSFYCVCGWNEHIRPDNGCPDCGKAVDQYLF